MGGENPNEIRGGRRFRAHVRRGSRRTLRPSLDKRRVVDAFADLYLDRYVKLRGLRSADEKSNSGSPFNRALGREYVARTPFRRGSQALIKFERENNRRIRRVTLEEEARCWQREIRWCTC
jgi:hypothetical protein